MSNYSEIPNNSTDCISRQAVIDSLYDWSNHSITDAETWHLRQVIGDIKSMPSVTPQLSSELEKNSKKLENPTKKYCGCCKHWKIKGVQKIGDKPTSYGKCTKLSISGFEVETTFNDNCSSEGLE